MGPYLVVSAMFRLKPQFTFTKKTYYFRSIVIKKIFFPGWRIKYVLILFWFPDFSMLKHLNIVPLFSPHRTVILEQAGFRGLLLSSLYCSSSCRDGSRVFLVETRLCIVARRIDRIWEIFQKLGDFLVSSRLGRLVVSLQLEYFRNGCYKDSLHWNTKIRGFFSRVTDSR